MEYRKASALHLSNHLPVTFGQESTLEPPKPKEIKVRSLFVACGCLWCLVVQRWTRRSLAKSWTASSIWSGWLFTFARWKLAPLYSIQEFFAPHTILELHLAIAHMTAFCGVFFWFCRDFFCAFDESLGFPAGSSRTTEQQTRFGGGYGRHGKAWRRAPLETVPDLQYSRTLCWIEKRTSEWTFPKYKFAFMIGVFFLIIEVSPIVWDTRQVKGMVFDSFWHSSHHWGDTTLRNSK